MDKEFYVRKFNSLNRLVNWAFYSFILFIVGYVINLLLDVNILLVSAGVVYLYICAIFWLELLKRLNTPDEIPIEVSDNRMDTLIKLLKFTVPILFLGTVLILLF